MKHQRAVVGASLDEIKERRNMRPEARAADRQKTVKDAKEKKAAAENAKKAEKAKNAANASKGGNKQGGKAPAPKASGKSR